MSALSSTNNGNGSFNSNPLITLLPEEVQELAQAKAEGRLMVLPCKTEDTVFIVYAKKILETTVDKRAWTDDDGYMLRTKEEWFKEKDIGKTVFLTREAAEKVIPTCNVTKLPCAGCNPVCEHRGGAEDG